MTLSDQTFFFEMFILTFKKVQIVSLHVFHSSHDITSLDLLFFGLFSSNVTSQGGYSKYT